VTHSRGCEYDGVTLRQWGAHRWLLDGQTGESVDRTAKLRLYREALVQVYWVGSVRRSTGQRGSR